MATCGLNAKQRSSGSLCRNASCEGCRPYRAPVLPFTDDHATFYPPREAAGGVHVKQAPIVPDYSHTPLMLEVETARAKHEERRYELAKAMWLRTAETFAAGVTAEQHAELCVKAVDALLTALQKPGV